LPNLQDRYVFFPGQRMMNLLRPISYRANAMSSVTRQGRVIVLGTVRHGHDRVRYQHDLSFTAGALAAYNKY